MSHIVDIKTSARVQFIDITTQVERLVRESGISSGICVIYTPHTTAGITINENADPSVKTDIIGKLAEIFPHHGDYRHLEGNSDAHLKSSVIGCSETLIVDEGGLLLGTWQGLIFCEFDGPRSRRFVVKIIGEQA